MDFLLPTNFVVICENNSRFWMLKIGFDDLLGVGFFVNIVLVCDSNELSFTGMNSKIKIATYVGVLFGDYFEVVFLGDFFNIGIGGGSSNNCLRWASLVKNGLDAGF